jgi:hypothetical protein
MLGRRRAPHCRKEEAEKEIIQMDVLLCPMPQD